MQRWLSIGHGFVLMLCVVFALPARAAAPFDYGSVALALDGERGAEKGALFFSLAPGWKVYWRNPGEIGFPPRLTWAGKSESVFSWPFPKAFEEFGIHSYGYEGDVVLPFRTSSPTASGEQVQVDYLVCREVCIPVVEDVTARPASPSERRRIAAAYERVPQTPSAQALEQQGGGLPEIKYQPLEHANVRIEGTWTVPSGQTLVDPEVILEDAQGGLFRVTRLSFEDNLLSFDAEGTFATPQRRVRLTLSSGADFWQTETDSILKPFRTETLSRLGLSPAALLFLLAFLGGMILNLMPCVFPVLALKVRAIAQARSAGVSALQTRIRLQKHFLASALGLWSAFLLLALGLLGLKAAGQGVGWGFQFHQPAFVGFVCIVLFILALDAFSLVPLPFSMPSGGKTGGGEQKESFRSDFLGGLLIAWIATPCSAPFLGSAISGALAGSALFTLALFIAMGFGMAAPYFLCACFPRQIVKILPRPGRWSQILRIVLGVPILLASLWLLAIFAKQTSTTTALVLSAFALVGAALAIVAHSRSRTRAIRLALVLPIVAALLLSLPSHQPSASTTRVASTGWEAFAPERIPALVEQGTLVLVDVTADWCLSCKLNDRRAFASPRVQQRWQDLQPFVRMRADWTRRDARIGRFLTRFDRHAIPFTVLLLSGAPPVLLPELFGEETLLDALRYTEMLRDLTRANENQNRTEL